MSREATKPRSREGGGSGRVPHRNSGLRRRAYVLLETVIATGLLIVGLAVIGAQLQESDKSVRKMERKMRALMLADAYVAQLDLGLIPLDTIERELDGDFGSRFPDWGWTLRTQETAIDGMYGLTLTVWHHLRDRPYTLNSFDFDRAEEVHRVYLLRAAPQALDLAVEFGLNDEELTQVADKLAPLGIEGLDPASFDPKALARLEFDQLIQVLPVIADVLGVDISYLTSLVPPDVLQSLRESGLLEGSGGIRGEGTEVPGGGGGT